MYLYENALSGDLTPAIRAWAGSLNKLQLIAMYNNRFNSVVSKHTRVHACVHALHCALLTDGANLLCCCSALAAAA